MGVALNERMTLAAFLDWESRQEFKYEFDGFAPVAMVGGDGGALRHPGQPDGTAVQPPARASLPGAR